MLTASDWPSLADGLARPQKAAATAQGCARKLCTLVCRMMATITP